MSEKTYEMYEEYEDDFDFEEYDEDYDYDYDYDYEMSYVKMTKSSRGNDYKSRRPKGHQLSIRKGGK